MSSPGGSRQASNMNVLDLKEGKQCCTNIHVNPVQTLHLGDSALHHPENGQARPEDPAGVGGSQGQAGETTAQEGNFGRHLH